MNQFPPFLLRIKKYQSILISMTALSMIMVSHAWTIGSKGRVSGPAIHTTYFMTPNNGAFEVTAQAYVGKIVSGSCQYSEVYDIGKEQIKTGDFVDIDGFALKALIGTRYNCMTIFYSAKQRVMETFLLIYDGINFITTYPVNSEITLAQAKLPLLLDTANHFGLFNTIQLI